MKIVLNYNSIKAFRPVVKAAIKQKNKELQLAIRDSTLQIYREAVEQSPVRTGRLQKHRFSISKYRGRIYPTVKYAYWVHEGTGLYGPLKRPYIIRPKTKKALRFKVGGKYIFVKKVVHPGIRPNPFYTRAIMKQDAWVRKRLQKVGVNLVNTLRKS